MQKISYYAFRGIVFLFSLLPFKVIYKIADFVAFVFRVILKYRRKIIYNNLKNSFPQKSDAEIHQIMCGVYQNIADIFVETIKGFSMTKETLLSRYKIMNPEILNSYYSENKSVLLSSGHYGNWEWSALALSYYFPFPVVALYKSLSNPYLEEFILQKRSKTGVIMRPTTQTRATFDAYKNKMCAYLFGADQNPSNTETAHWVSFLNQDTACQHGLDTISRTNNFPVFYGHIKRVGRGYYEIMLEPLCINPLEQAPEAITQLFMAKLEKIIIEKPEDWLWSHRRWKHKRK